MARLILDTGVLIAGARGRVAWRRWPIPTTWRLQRSQSPSTSLAPCWTRSRTRRRAAAFLDEILDVVPIHVYDRAVANHHGELLAHLQRTGSKRGGHDLIIAATARAAERTVLTTDERAASASYPSSLSAPSAAEGITHHPVRMASRCRAE